MPVVLIMSSNSFIRCILPSLGSCPLTISFGPATRKPVPIPASNASPASCSRTNWWYGLVAIQSIDHPVAIVPRVGPFAVGFEPGRFRIEPGRANDWPSVRRIVRWPALFKPVWKMPRDQDQQRMRRPPPSRRQPVHHEMQPTNRVRRAAGAGEVNPLACSLAWMNASIGSPCPGASGRLTSWNAQ